MFVFDLETIYFTEIKTIMIKSCFNFNKWLKCSLTFLIVTPSLRGLLLRESCLTCFLDFKFLFCDIRTQCFCSKYSIKLKKNIKCTCYMIFFRLRNSIPALLNTMITFLFTVLNMVLISVLFEIDKICIRRYLKFIESWFLLLNLRTRRDISNC